ncbi:MAG: branched-chain amino acid ABC transporter permease [Oscillospiraceae bacterium]|nr:branched-chain amino acid ABC transporter permease [Oscillospiraceae bacterium]
MKHERTIPTPIKYLINTVLTVLILAGGTALMNAGAFNRATTAIIQQIGIYIILAVSLNMVVGYLGQLPLGHSGFMAVGAYAGALFWKATQSVMPSFLTILLGLIVAGLAAALFGVIIGIPALRLKGDYLAIITLGFSEIIRICIINLPNITGGTPGLLNIPKYSGFFVVFASVAVTCYVIHTIMHSRHGRAILSIRDNEIAADACGINLTYYKVFTFAVSAFFAGVAGALYAGYQGSLFPKSFDFMASINILVMVVLGGMGSMLGSAVAATVLTALPLVMQSLSEYRMVIYSLLLIIVMIFKPSGLMGQYDFSFTGIIENIMNGRLFRRKKKAGGTKNE